MEDGSCGNTCNGMVLVWSHSFNVWRQKTNQIKLVRFKPQRGDSIVKISKTMGHKYSFKSGFGLL